MALVLGLGPWAKAMAPGPIFIVTDTQNPERVSSGFACPIFIVTGTQNPEEVNNNETHLY